jgi:hypothetical protein
MPTSIDANREPVLSPLYLFVFFFFFLLSAYGGLVVGPRISIASTSRPALFAPDQPRSVPDSPMVASMANRPP